MATTPAGQLDLNYGLDDVPTPFPKALGLGLQHVLTMFGATIAVPLLLAIMFKVLWKVPAADQALIVTGFGVKGRAVGDRIFKIITGGGAFVVPSFAVLDNYQRTIEAFGNGAANILIGGLGNDLLEFAEAPRDVLVLDENGKPLTAGDRNRRFFEAAAN